MSEQGETGTTAAPNNATGAAETVVVPDTKAEKDADPATSTTAAAPGISAPADAAKTETKPAAEKPKTTPIQELWALAKDHGHHEVWGVKLADPEHSVPSQIVLQKYVNANDGDLVKAKDQLTKTLDWRKEMKPVELLHKKFNREKFEGLGYVTSYGDAKEGPEGREVFTWNIYGIVKDMNKTFGDLKQFMEWRVALMELALQSLDIANATKPITATDDPYKIFQVHDYKSISFFRQQPQVKTASQEVIKVFAQNYPELLKEKFFVNVPAIMGFLYAFMKLFVAAKTAKKFHPMSNGGALAHEFSNSKVGGLGEKIPAEYGGKGEDLKTSGKQPELE